MKAIVYKKYGKPENLNLVELEKPEPGGNEVLVKVHAVSLNAYDWHMLTADIPLVRFSAGFSKPKVPVPGADIAGTIESVGSGVKTFKPGDRIYTDLAMSGQGGLSEYTLVPENRLHLIPDGISFEEAAAVPMAGVTALGALRDRGEIAPGKKVLINGASGGVGTFAIQIAKAYGAEVTAVCSSRNLKLAAELGADHVIDYARADFTKNGNRYDIILAINGYHPISAYKKSLTEKGRYIGIGGKPKQMMEGVILGPILSSKKGKRLGMYMSIPKPEDQEYLSELLKKKKVKPVIDKKFPLEKTADAFRYLGDGHAQGKIVVTL